jgi:hypothetical protein
VSVSITFAQTWQYLDDRAGITIPALLSYGGRIVAATAKVDTGAEFCLFNRDYGERLGLDIEEGLPIVMETLGGTLEAFGHEVTIQTLGLAFQSVVYFSRDPGLARNLLGRSGWLRNLRLGVIDYESRLLLSDYNEE